MGENNRDNIMLGLAVLFVMVIYFVALFFVTRFCYKKAINKGKNRKVAFLFVLLGFSLVFLPVFWDFIPNRIYFNYLCENDTKLQVYKTFDEWNAENPGVFETLYPLDGEGQADYQTINNKNYRAYSSSINQRLGFYRSYPSFEYLPFHLKRSTYILYDYIKGDILAIEHSIYSGSGNVIEVSGDSYKVWLNQECINNNENSGKSYTIRDFATQFNVFSD
jgi:hypothetical protein